MKNKSLAIMTIMLLSVIAGKAQIAQGGTYKIEQSLVASGGGTNSTGGTYNLDGSIGEAAAGTTSTGSTFSIKSGFLTTQIFAPTAATASFGGRLETTDGNGLRNALVVLTDSRGYQRLVTSGENGSFRFDDLAAGETYIVSVMSKRFVFPTQVVFIGENVDDIVIRATAQTGFGVQQLPGRIKSY